LLALALATLLLNSISTGDYLWRTLSQAQWAIVGVDGALLLTACLPTPVWLGLGRRKARALQLEALEDA
jgi:hypothetical protein